MNCTKLLDATGWECRSTGFRSVRATSPLTFGDDGHHAAFYVAQPDDSTFFLTDAGESAMHAAAFGSVLNRARINVLNATHGVQFAKIDSDWAITASGPIAELQIALWDAVKLAMSLSFSVRKWSPKLDQVRFRALVEKALIEVVGRDQILKSPRVQGMSGHMVEFPFAIRAGNDELYYIEPIALTNEKIDWQHIYQVHGKLSDVKQADEVNHRLVIFEDGAPQVEFGRASTLLAQSASIKSLSQMNRWLHAEARVAAR